VRLQLQINDAEQGKVPSFVSDFCVSNLGHFLENPGFEICQQGKLEKSGKPVAFKNIKRFGFAVCYSYYSLIFSSLTASFHHNFVFSKRKF